MAAPTSGAVPTTTAPAEPGAVAGGARPPDGAAPGTLLGAEEGPARAGARSWTIRYVSEGVEGRPVAVTGFVVAPDGPAPAGGRPVLSWGHGTTGSADGSAPSRRTVRSIDGLDGLLAAGFVVAATDYEGLGAPGPHPYLVAASEGRSVLDAARAAARLPDTGANSRAVLWGHSQGGHAVLAAAAMAAAYAPDLTVLGVAGAAPAARVSALLPRVEGRGVLGAYYLLAAAGLAAADPSLPVNDILSPTGRTLLPLVEQRCLVPLAVEVAASGEAMSAGDPATSEPWASLLRAADVGEEPLAVPVRIDAGGRDELFDLGATTALAERLCRGDGAVQLVVHGEADHLEVVTAAAPATVRWLAERVAGAPAPSSCATRAPGRKPQRGAGVGR